MIGNEGLIIEIVSEYHKKVAKGKVKFLEQNRSCVLADSYKYHFKQLLKCEIYICIISRQTFWGFWFSNRVTNGVVDNGLCKLWDA